MEVMVNKVSEQVAAQNHVSIEEVRMEMQLAISEAMKSDNPTAKAFWKQLSPGGTPPTPDELIPLLAAICHT